MDITVNDINYTIPFDVSQISLADFLDYYRQYGRELDKEMAAVNEKQYEGDEETAALMHTLAIDSQLDKEALAWFSFWTKKDFMNAGDVPNVGELIIWYKTFKPLLIQSQEASMDALEKRIEWNDAVWEIQPHTVTPTSKMSFNEIITSKEIIRQVYAIGQNSWDALPYLCAVFFRKQGELFEDIFIVEGSERLELMKTLPLSIALQVSFFLASCVSTWKTRLAFSEKVEDLEMLN